jgi:hypothetical protein
MRTLSRPPETTPEATEVARQENDATRTAQAVSGASPAYLAGPDNTMAAVGTSGSAGTVGSRVSVTPTSGNAESQLQNSNTQIAQAYSGGSPSPADMRAASEAYQREAGAVTDLAQQQQGNGARGLDITA